MKIMVYCVLLTLMTMLKISISLSKSAYQKFHFFFQKLRQDFVKTPLKLNDQTTLHTPPISLDG